MNIAPVRENAIVEELAQHLDDCCEEWLASGASEDEAYRAALAELSGSERLRRELRRVEWLVGGLSGLANKCASALCSRRYFGSTVRL